MKEGYAGGVDCLHGGCGRRGRADLLKVAVVGRLVLNSSRFQRKLSQRPNTTKGKEL